MTEYGERRLVAVLACRNDGLRLYGKPLQTLCAESGTTILEYLVKASSKSDLGISQAFTHLKITAILFN